MGRLIKDASLIKVKALPAANANNTCDAIDLGPGAYKPEEMEIEVSVPATPALADNLAITFTIVHGATSSPATSTGISFTVTGVATSAGGPATTKRFRLPSDTLRYVAVNAAVANSGGNNTAVSYTTSLLF